MEEYIQALEELFDTINHKLDSINDNMRKANDILKNMIGDTQHDCKLETKGYCSCIEVGEIILEAKRLTQHND